MGVTEMFKFENYPMLRNHHLEHEKLGNRFSNLGYKIEQMPPTEKLKKEYDEALVKSNKFDFEIYARAIYDVFSKIKPILTSSQGGIFKWDEIFGKPFNELNITEKTQLICMIEEEGARRYSLPKEYYNDIEWTHVVRAQALIKEIKKLFNKNKVAFSKEDETMLVSIIIKNDCHSKNINQILADINKAFENDNRRETFIKLVQLYVNYLRR